MENLRGRRGLRRGAEAAIDFAAETERAYLHAAQVSAALHLVAKPAAHANAGVAAHERLHTERRVKLIPQSLTATGIDPGDMLAGREPERHGGEERRGRHLALPVERRGVADLGNAAADRVEHLEGRYDLTGGMHRDVELAAGERADTLGDAFRRHAGTGQTLGPRRHHAPALGLRECQRGRRERARGAACGNPSKLSARDVRHGWPPCSWCASATTSDKNDAPDHGLRRSQGDRMQRWRW